MLTITLTILTVASFIWYKKDWYKKDKWNGFAFASHITTGALLAISLIALPVNHYSGMAEIERYKALKESYEYSRTQEVSDYERATITQKIAEYNADIASVRYWNSTIFDEFISDKLAELEYLR